MNPLSAAEPQQAAYPLQAGRPVGDASLPGEAADRRRWTAAQYRTLFGWDVVQGDHGLMLELGRGIAAMPVPKARAVSVAEQLMRLGTTGPVIAVDDERPHWIFLADSNADLTFHADLPGQLEVLGCGWRIPLPGRNAYSASLRWVVAPDPGQRWLPTLATLALAVRLERRD